METLEDLMKNTGHETHRVYTLKEGIRKRDEMLKVAREALEAITAETAVNDFVAKNTYNNAREIIATIEEMEKL